MTNVISYSLFRSPASRFSKPEAGEFRNRFYEAHLPLVIRACAACLPGWQIRIHHDSDLNQCWYAEALHWLERAGLVKLVHMGPSKSLCESMLWRMAPAWDPTVERFICRDLDSVMGPREASLVQEWVKSGYVCHSIHDHPGHRGTPLMGGMIGFVGPALAERWRGVASFGALVSGHDLSAHGSDQRLLNQKVWPIVRNATLMHQLPGADEGAAKTLPVVSTVTDSFPHIGAVFTEYEGTQYCGPTYDASTIRRRLRAGLSFFKSWEPDKNAGVMGKIQMAEASAGVTDEIPGPDLAAAAPSAPVHERYALFSSSLNEDYAFYLPLTVRMWSGVCGFGSIINLVGEPSEWSAGKFGVALDEAKAQGAEIEFIPRCIGHQDSTVAQVSRLYAGALGHLPDSVYVMTSDADMFPMSRDFFHATDPGKPLHILYANAYTRQHNGRTIREQKYPICYLGATVGVWKQIMRLGSKPFPQELQDQLDGGLSRDRKPGDMGAWNYDELLFGVRAHEWSGIRNAQMRDRRGGPPADRIDRSGWQNDPETIKRAADAHLLRPAQSDANWPRVRQLIESRLGGEAAAWADGYRQKFVAA